MNAANHSPPLDDLRDTLRDLYPRAWAACLTPLCHPLPPHTHPKKEGEEWVEVPCDHPGKRPLGSDWNINAMARLQLQNGSEEANQQLDQHVLEIAKHVAHGGNVGLVIPPGVVVIDIDDDDSMLATNHIAEFQHAPRQLTKKGAHFPFQAPSEATSWPQDTKLKLSNGVTVDLRLAEKGQVVVEPSIHESGIPYHWDRELPETRSELPFLSEGMVRMISEAVRSKKKKKPQGGSSDGKIGEGERHTFLVSAAGLLVNAGVIADELLCRLLGLNALRCQPPLPESEVRTIHASASQWEPGEPKSGSSDGSTNSPDDDESKTARTQRLLAEIIDRATYFRTPEGLAYASIPVDGHRETRAVESQGYADWIERCFWEETRSYPPEKPFEAGIRKARQNARFEGDVRPVALRCAITGDLRDGSAKIFLDLCDEKWNQIEISPSGWRVVSDSPVHLRRTPGMLPLPKPAAQGDVSLLRGVLNISSEYDFIMFIAWVLSVILPGCPQPIAVVNGPQGAGKSTASELAGQAADPNIRHVSGFPRSIEDFHISADNARVVAIDNVSNLRPEISDELARASTGAVFRKRSHYKNREQQTFMTKAPVILNGIPDFVSRPDLAERSIFIDLARIPKEKRRAEAEILAEFQLIHPMVLTGLLDAAVMGLRNMPTVSVSNLERMADFHQWMRACEPALPWSIGDFDAAYQANRKRARERLMESSEAFGALVSFMERRREWCGTGKELLAQLRIHAGLNSGDDAKGWPRAGKGMVALLGRVVGELSEEGIQFIPPKRSPGGNRDRVLVLFWEENQPSVGNQSSQTSQSSPHNGASECDFGTIGTIGTMDSEESGKNFQGETSPQDESWGDADDGTF